MYKQINKINEKGTSFLEIILVIAIVGIATSFVMPSISSWKINSLVEKDFQAMVSEIEYLKTRASSLNGTALLICIGNNNEPNQIITHQTANCRSQYSNTLCQQDPSDSYGETFKNNLIENPSSANPSFNIVSGKTNIAGSPCGYSGSFAEASARTGYVFQSNGQSMIKSSSWGLDIEINYNNDKINYPAYRIAVSRTTSFVQKYKWNKKISNWVEID
jgi:Tfp pilus assembly protein FimT